MQLSRLAVAVLLALSCVPVPVPAQQAADPSLAVQGPAAQPRRVAGAQPGASPEGQSVIINPPLLASLPALPRLAGPPGAVFGVLIVPEVMGQSLAAQEAERTLGAQQRRLREDIQTEQAAWRNMQQALAAQQGKLKPDQFRKQALTLQQRINAAQQRLRQRSNGLQQESQMTLGHIQQTLVAIVRQVAESRGMNMVMQGDAAVLNTNDFDITKQVADRLNEVLPSVKQFMVEGPMPPR